MRHQPTIIPVRTMQVHPRTTSGWCGTIAGYENKDIGLWVVGCATVFASSPAKIEDFPSIVQVETGFGPVWLQTCVGTIVTSRHVLTAAHCLIGAVVNPRISRVRAGASERGRDGQIVAVDSAVRHPSYTFKSFDGNVGIIRLQSNLVFDSTVQQASIAAAGVVFPANVAVTIAGWGRTAQEGLWSDRNLHSTQLHTSDHATCVTKYNELLLPIEVTDNMICATMPGTDGANWGIRDGGSPVFYDGILVGFLSFGSPNGSNASYPLLATAVSPYSDWIVENASS